jgi:hypothetical protein
MALYYETFFPTTTTILLPTNLGGKGVSVLSVNTKIGFYSSSNPVHRKEV